MYRRNDLTVRQVRSIRIFNSLLYRICYVCIISCTILYDIKLMFGDLPMTRLNVEADVRKVLSNECGVIFGNTSQAGKVLRHCLDKILERDSKDRYANRWGVFGIDMESVARDDIEAYMTRVIIRSTSISADYVDKLIEFECPKKERVHDALCRVGLETAHDKRHLDRFAFVVEYAEEISEKNDNFKAAFRRGLPN